MTPNAHTASQTTTFTAQPGPFEGPRALLEANRRTGGRLAANPEMALSLASVPFRAQSQDQADRLVAAAEVGLRSQMLALRPTAPDQSNAQSNIPGGILATTVQQSTANSTAAARSTINSLRDQVVLIVESTPGRSPESKRSKVEHVEEATSRIRRRLVNPADPKHQLSVNVAQGATIDLARNASPAPVPAVIRIWNDAIEDVLGPAQPSALTPGNWGLL
jgi:hypothetical protein